MIVKSLKINEMYLNNGVGGREIEFRELGKFITLAGKNGSGKTRILNSIFSSLNIYIQEFLRIESMLAEHNKKFDEELWLRDDNSFIEHEIENSPHKYLLKNLKICTFSDIRIYNMVPKPYPFRSYREDPVSAMEDSKFNIINSDVSHISQRLTHYIYNIFRNYYTLKGFSFENKDQFSQVELNFQHLNHIVEKLLDCKLDTSINSDGMSIKIFGRPIEEDHLSEGQKILLQAAVAIHARSDLNQNMIFFLDEPENHLHPSSVINFIELVETSVDKAQFFIATHSVPLISYLHEREKSCLYFVDSGMVKYAGRLPEIVLSSLLGNQRRINELRSFTELPSIYAQINYASQCLSAPGVHSESTGDSQNNQISEVLKQISINRPLRVLDFGAGRGRVLAGLAENFSDSLLKKIDYFAYDKFKDNSEECLSIIKRYYPDNHIERYKNKLSDLMNNSNNLKGTFDVIMMCNVLHELDPSDYYSLFEKNSHLNALLSDDGYILIVEDNQIPIGENAHKFGFIVLNTSDIRELFSIPSGSIDGLVRHSTQEGRLTAHLVHKKHLKNITQNTIGAAITSVKTTAKEKMKIMRGPNQESYKDGMGHAFWVQQYANACLYLEETGATS